MEKKMVIHPSVKNYIGSLILGAVLLLSGVFAIGAIIIFIYVFVKVKTTTYTITEDKLVAEQGFLSKRRISLFLSDIRNVEMVQSTSQRIFKLGTVHISTAGNAGNEVTMSGVSDPELIVQNLNAGHK